MGICFLSIVNLLILYVGILNRVAANGKANEYGSSFREGANAARPNEAFVFTGHGPVLYGLVILSFSKVYHLVYAMSQLDLEK